MKKQILAAMLAASSFGFMNSPVLAYPSIFPDTGYSWVGDTMPYYDGEQFRIFYLEDMRDGEVGFHPWSSLTTKDFVDYQQDSMVIPYDTENM